MAIDLPDNILSRLAALEAMANHPGSNANEAAVAAEKLSELLSRFSLDSIPHAGEKELPFGVVEFDLDSSRWKSILINGCAKANDCKAIRCTSVSTSRYALVGREHQIEVTRYLFDVFVRSINKLASHEHSPNRYTSDRSWRNDYRLGATVAINAGLVEGNKRDRENAPADTKAIIVAQDQALVEAYRRAFPRLNAVRKGLLPSGEAYRRGYTAGQGVSAPAGINASRSSVRRLA